MPPSLGHIKQKAVFPMETMKTASVNACYSSIMLKVTVMAVAAPFYGKKGSALQPHLKDLFPKFHPGGQIFLAQSLSKQIFVCSLRSFIPHTAAKPRGIGDRSPFYLR